ncbi:PsbP-related protein [Paenibacillus xylanexedens]|uniref:PsbP-related protein n=1 Tax=Paenibacillus sp. FSL R7-0272 TaxID=2921679 RepID=UPI0012B7F5B9|nr:PsbP-related protein [Paenibacillus xylanexedens]
MKYLIIITLIIVITGCESITDVDKKENIVTNESNTYTSVEHDESDVGWTTYHNSRFGFSISYPGDWTAGEESDNGDGKQLYVGNPDVDIRAYGSQVFEGVENAVSESMKYQSLKLDSEIKADMWVGYEDDMVVIEVSWMSDDEIEYHYYVKVSKDFFDRNENTIIRIAKSMKAI